VARTLAERGYDVVGATRRPGLQTAVRAERAGDATSPPAPRWVELDLERPETFAPALEGVRRVFLLARPGDPEPERVAAPFVEAMVAAGVEHVANLTSFGVEERDDIPLRKVELALEASGLGWTHLRPNWFMQVFAGPPLLGSILTEGRIAVPAGDATISWIDARDVGAVAVEALEDPERHGGRAWTLTGGEALGHEAVARAISEATGRTVRYDPIDDEEARRRVVEAGLGEARAERIVGFYRLVRGGACSPVVDHAERVLGRAPRRFDAFAREHRDRWIPPDSPRP
jgi:uncharacterized protein YbjT (DUF2867 family)